MQIGTRDAALRPSHTFAVGAVVHEDRETVTVFVPSARAGRMLTDPESTGRVALGETYRKALLEVLRPLG